MLQTNRGVHPVVIGPVLLHGKKDFDSFFQLPASMVRFLKDLLQLRCFGTDGEVNVHEALKSVFGDAYHLLCNTHMRDNIESKLAELGINGTFKNDIIRDSFGYVDGETKIKGIVDSARSDEVEARLIKLAEKWKMQSCKGGASSNYMEKHEILLIRNSMTARVRTSAGRGFPPDVYTQNANEI